MKAALNILKDEHRCLCHNSKNSLIIDKTMYLHGVESILHRFLTNDEVEVVLNDFHGGLSGGQLSGIATRVIFGGEIFPIGYFLHFFQKTNSLFGHF